MSYYEILKKVSWRTIPRFVEHNQFGKYYPTIGQELDPKINELIKDRINDSKPLLIGRHGAVELRAITNIHAYDTRSNILIDSLLFLISKKAKFWELDETLFKTLCFNAGFFPQDEKHIRQFAKLFIEESKKIDIYGASTRVEHLLPKNTIPIGIPMTYIRNLEPWFYSDPWSYALKDKKVLIIYPLKELIISQYQKRESLFENKKILPKFDLQVLESVQSIALNKTKFNNWFDALEHQKEMISQRDFDIAIIGCGAYGFPLAAYVKDLGKKAIHFGSATQFLFGIKGGFWLKSERYVRLMNGNWVFPSEKDVPEGAEKIENKAYW